MKGGQLFFQSGPGCPGVEFQNFLLGSSIPLFLKCSPKRRTWHVLGLFPSLWPCVVGRLVGDRWKVVERCSGGGWRVVGVVGGGRRGKVVGNWLAVVVWRVAAWFFWCGTVGASPISIFGSCSAILHAICFFSTVYILSDQQAAGISHLEIQQVQGGFSAWFGVSVVRSAKWGGLGFVCQFDVWFGACVDLDGIFGVWSVVLAPGIWYWMWSAVVVFFGDRWAWSVFWAFGAVCGRVFWAPHWCLVGRFPPCLRGSCPSFCGLCSVKKHAHISRVLSKFQRFPYRNWRLDLRQMAPSNLRDEASPCLSLQPNLHLATGLDFHKSFFPIVQ